MDPPQSGGRGAFTLAPFYADRARFLLRLGQLVARGEPIGISDCAAAATGRTSTSRSGSRAGRLHRCGNTGDYVLAIDTGGA